MSCKSTPNIHQTYIIEPTLTGFTPTLTACTALYTNNIVSCSGDTTISMGTGIVTFNSAISATSVNTLNYFSGGTNLLEIFSGDTYVTGGTFNKNAETLTLTNNDNVNFTITGFTDVFTTGGTLINNTLYFDTTDALSAYTIDLSSLVVTDIFVTGATFNQTTRVLDISRNDNFNISVSGFSDSFTTAATYTNGYVYFDRNDSLSAYTLDLTAISGDSNTFVSGGTLNGDLLELVRTDNVTVSIDLEDLRFSGGTGHCITDFYVTNIHGCSPITFYDTLIVLSGITMNLPPEDNSQTQMVVRDSGTGELKYRDVASIISAATSQDVYVTGLTFSSNNLTITRNDNVSYSVLLDNFSGLTVTGNLTTNSLSANTITANTITSNILSATTISGNIFSGGTYYGDGSNLSGISTNNFYTTGTTLIGSTVYFDRNDVLSGYTVDLSPLTAATNTNVTGFTFNPIGNVLTIGRNNQPSLTTNIYELTNIGISGLTVSGDSTFKNNITIDGNATVLGNVTILGTATTINTETLTVEDNIITINSSATGGTAPFPINSGLEVLRNSATTATLIWNETTDRWEAGLSGATNQIILSSNGLSDLAFTAHTHPIGEIVNLQSILDSKLSLTGGTLTGQLNGTIISATTISGGTLYGDGSNLTGIPDIYVTGGTLTGNNLDLFRNDNTTISITGFTGFSDNYTTGVTLSNTDLIFDRTDTLSAYTVNIGGVLYWISGSTGTGSVRLNTFSGTDATGNYSISEGYGSKAIGQYSHAEGYLTTASGQSSHVEGQNSVANGLASHAEGKNTSADGGCAHTEGDGTIASGTTSHAEGANTIAGGLSSHAEGNSTLAIGDNSHAEGYSTTTLGDNSHAEGFLTTALGVGSHAEGINSQAIGDYSHAGGSNNIFKTGVVKTPGIASFNHSFVDKNEPISGSAGNYSAILGGTNQNILNGATNSGILGGSGNTVNIGVTGSVILGGVNLTATTSNTAYVHNLNIFNTPNDESLTDVLVTDANGNVKYRSVASIISGATSGNTNITGFTYNNQNTFIISDDNNVSYSANFSTITGLTTSGDINPTTDNTVNLGTPIKRFRDINTVSGTSTVWTSTTSVITPLLDLGLDSSGNTRQITADNSIIQNDILNGGNF